MLSPQAQAFEDALRALSDNVIEGEPTLEDQREASAAFGAMTAEPAGVTYTETEIAGRRAQWIEPEGAATDRVLLYVHGGGYVLCSLETHAKLVGHLCKAIGCRGLNFDYRLAPEHPHPAAVEDSTAAYRALLDMGIEPGHIAIAGDSAGGGLTVATLLKLRDEGDPMPAAGVPLSPWADLEGLGESMTSNAASDLLVQQEGLKGMSDMFLNGQDARDPLAAPLYASYEGLAPMYIQVGGAETLLDDSTRVAARAARAGVEVRLDVFPGMQHVFQMAAGNVPEADDAVARIGDWLRPKLGL
ncbi:MAG: alpha/beta hydrolase [Actinomycetia bacterium]|nr:alpha/beta hydrolase [Actinomycetes bacterium]